MLMQEERELVVEYGRKMSTDRLSTGTSGNISVCNAEKGLMAISPSGMDYFSTTPEDVVITDLEANIVDGVRKPSSEWALHTAFYRHKPHARAVVHTHSMYCTTFAVLASPSGCPLCNRRHRSSHRPLRAVPPLRHSGAGRGRHRGLRRQRRRSAEQPRPGGLAAGTSKVLTAWLVIWSMSRSCSTGPCARHAPIS